MHVLPSKAPVTALMRESNSASFYLGRDSYLWWPGGEGGEKFQELEWHNKEEVGINQIFILIPALSLINCIILHLKVLFYFIFLVSVYFIF